MRLPPGSVFRTRRSAIHPAATHASVNKPITRRKILFIQTASGIEMIPMISMLVAYERPTHRCQ
jgi:hypothetical protein